MGSILKIQKFTTLMEGVILTVSLLIVLGGVYWFAPGLRVSASKQMTALDLNSENLNNTTKGALLPLPTTVPSTAVANKGLMRIGEYAWICNSGMIVSNG